jgi:tetratricopeptide (TPR) repeat protein
MTTLALSMIVRDAADFLARCLESARPFADQIVIADTGSQDQTIAIARSFGAKVIEIPWQDDFAAARNRCLEHAASDWILVLDADEMLDPETAPLLRGHLSTGAAGYNVAIRNFVLSLQDRIWDKPARPNDCSLPAGKVFPAYVDHQNVRLFRNDPAIRFAGRVHESVGPSLLRQNRKLSDASFLIYHFGLAASESRRAEKNVFYRELGRRKIREMPNDAQAHLELGLVEMDNFGSLNEAAALFARSCELNPRFALAAFFHGLALVRLEKYADALPVLARAESLGLRTAVVAETMGDAQFNLGAFRRAVSRYQSALRRDPSSPGLTSKLGLALVRNGDTASGFRQLDAAIQQQPLSGELYDRKMAAHLASGDLQAAALALEEKLSFAQKLSASDFVRAAALWAKASRSDRALHLVTVGLARHPEDKKLLMARDQLSPSLLPSTR